MSEAIGILGLLVPTANIERNAMRAQNRTGGPDVSLLDSVLRLEPRRRREVGELLIELQLRELSDPSEDQVRGFMRAIGEAVRIGDWHRPWDETIGAVLDEASQVDLAK